MRTVWAGGLIGLILALTAFAVGYNPPDVDIKYDWLISRESLRQGGDAFRDVLDIARDEGVSVSVHSSSGTIRLTGHPRSPAAIILQLPLIVLPYDTLFAFSLLASMVAMGVVASLVARPDRTAVRAIVLLASIGLAPLFVTLRFAGQGAVVAALVLWGWSSLREGDSIKGGVLLALASVLKVFPALLLVPLLWRKRFRAATVMVSVMIVANVWGLLLPGVSLARVVEELPKATATWVGLVSNGSLVRVFTQFGLGAFPSQLVAVIALIGVFLWLLRKQREATVEVLFVWVALGLLAIPLSWVSYDLVLLPAVVALVMSRQRVQHLTGLLAAGLWAIPVLVLPLVVVDSGFFSLVIRLGVVLLALVYADTFEDWRLRPITPGLRRGRSLPIADPV